MGDGVGLSNEGEPFLQFVKRKAPSVGSSEPTFLLPSSRELWIRGAGMKLNAKGAFLIMAASVFRRSGREKGMERFCEHWPPWTRESPGP